MKIIEDLDYLQRNDLKRQFQQHQKHQIHLYQTHIEPVLNKPHCYKVDIFAGDFERLIIHACLQPDTPYQFLTYAMDYISRNPDFLETTSKGCLDGLQVGRYIETLDKCTSMLRDSFSRQGNCFILDKNSSQDTMHNEVTDRMHRLVAYGLFVKMNESEFPINVYLGTNKAAHVVEAR